MAIYSKNKALMYKIFLSSLCPTAMRWFNGLEKGSIHSYDELAWALWARFVICSRVPKLFNLLITMSMREGEILKAYFN